jgi:hypothetical protein
MPEAELKALIQRLSAGIAPQSDVGVGLAHVIKILDSQVETVRDHDHWIWAAKGALALTLLFIGLVVYVFQDVRQELRRKMDIEVVQQHLDNLDHHLEVLDARIERLRDMVPGQRREGGP